MKSHKHRNSASKKTPMESWPRIAGDGIKSHLPKGSQPPLRTGGMADSSKLPKPGGRR